jgi:hypothetical protein
LETLTDSTEPAKAVTPERKLCFYLNPDGLWQKRLELDALKIGQELTCTLSSHQKLFAGKTGHKIFCECGVGRRSKDGENWMMVFGLLRLDRKASAAQKKLQRLQGKPCFTAYVSRIRPSNDEFEIVLSADNVVTEGNRKVSVSSLRVGQEGLEEAGLGKGERVRLQVASLKSKRLTLDFTNSVKAEALKEKEERTRQEEQSRMAAQLPAIAVSQAVLSPPAVYEQELEQGTSSFLNSDEEEDDWDEDYDEDRDIEDQLGLGMY